MNTYIAMYSATMCIHKVRNTFNGEQVLILSDGFTMFLGDFVFAMRVELAK